MKVLLLSCILVLVPEASCSTRQQKHEEFQAKLQGRPGFSLNTQPLLSASGTKQSGIVFYPIGYGADPSGLQESADAILNALDDAFKVQNRSELLPGINDLGGVVIDLQGGNYKISKPIRFPASGGGNVVVKGGTLRASGTFPGDRHLVELWSPKSHLHHPVRDTLIYYEDITFRDILFDSSFRGGGIFVIDSARIRINNCFFLHFTTQGILVRQGHETFISGCFLGQHSTIGGDKDEKYFSGTAIDLASNDNAITDVVIFSAETGILLRGQANVVTGAHCYNKATVYGGVGISVKLGGSLTRINSCYLDYTGIVIEDPLQVSVTNGLFFGGANIILRSVNGRISGTIIVDNMFNGNSQNSYPTVKLDGRFTDIDQVLIDRNNVNGMIMKSTMGKALESGNGTKWVANFSSILVFPNRIDNFQYSFYVQDIMSTGFVLHTVTNISDNIVVVESNKPANAIVSVTVDQYNYDKIGKSYVL